MKYKVNLLPLDLQEKKFNFKRFIKIMVAVVVLVTMLAWGGVHGWQFYQEQLEIKKELAELQQEYSIEKATADQAEQLRKEREKWERRIVVLNSMIDKRQTWPGLLKEIRSCVPGDLWFESLEINYNGLDSIMFSDLIIPDGVPEDTANLQQDDTVTGAAKDALIGAVSNVITGAVPGTVGTEQGDIFDNETGANTVTITGKSITVEAIGKFVYKLNQMDQKKEESTPDGELLKIKLGDVRLEEITRDKGTNVFNFTVSAMLKEVNESEVTGN